MLTALGSSRTQVIDIYDSVRDWLMSGSPLANAAYNLLDTNEAVYRVFDYVLS